MVIAHIRTSIIHTFKTFIETYYVLDIVLQTENETLELQGEICS